MALLPSNPRRSARLSDPVERDLEMQRAAEDLVLPVGRRVDDQPRVPAAPQERFQWDVDLESREWPADAAVYSAAPAHVLVVRAQDVELLGIGGSLGISVGRALPQGHPPRRRGDPS